MDTAAGFDGIERELGGSPELSIIWLHGLGADAGDFLPIVGELALPCPTRFVFPNAPFRSVTINGGMIMRAWYDIYGFDVGSHEDTPGLLASASAVRQLVAREGERGIPSGRVVLVGFSQGGAVVLHAGLGGGQPIGGILGLSTYLPAPALLAGSATLTPDIPVWLAHGIADPVIPLPAAEASARALRGMGVAVDWSTYPMGHEVTLAEIGDINAWLRRFAVV